MPILRRSLNNNNNSASSSSSAISPSSAVSPPLPQALNRPSEKVAPPQKVIKALRTHKSTKPQELSYVAGDFWYVTGEREGWFEALSKSRENYPGLGRCQ
jgi:bud emergence protein 1